MKMKVLFILCLLITISFSSINPTNLLICLALDEEANKLIPQMTEVFNNLSDYKGLIHFINKNFRILKKPLGKCLKQK